MSSRRVDRSDPAVRRAVYSHYRGILGKYNDQANSIVGTLPKERVLEDKGIADRLQSMIQQSNEIQSNGSKPAPGNGAPPPPPPPSVGSIPAVRLASEIGAKKSYEPPAAIQNAMMTKDKKPFTYTPGGLDLSEIRSPRMARRINMNANIQDSCSHPQPSGPASPPSPLPPAAQAAIQPQIAVPVFPPPPPPVGLHQAPPPPPPIGLHQAPPPPPPVGLHQAPPPPVGLHQAPPPPPPVGLHQAPPPPPPVGLHQAPPPTTQQAPPPPPLPNQAVPCSTQQAPSRSPQLDSQLPRPEFLADIACHPPLRPVGQPPRSAYDPSAQQSLQDQLKPVSPRPSPEPTVGVETGGERACPVAPPAKPAPTTLPQAKPTQRGPATPPLATIAGQGGGNTPPLSKSPAPWMTSKPAQKESPPPWAVRMEAPQPSQQSIRPPSQQPASQQSASYQPPSQQPASQQSASYQPPSQQPSQPASQQSASYQPPSQQAVTRIIPIQIEGQEPAVKSPLVRTAQSVPPSPPPPGYRHVQPSANLSGHAHQQPQQWQHPQQSPQWQPPQQQSPQWQPPQQQSPQWQPPQQQSPQWQPPQQQSPQWQPPQQQPPQWQPPQQQSPQWQPPQQQSPQWQPPQQQWQPPQQQTSDQAGKTHIVPIQVEGAGKPPLVYQSQNSYPGNTQPRSHNGDAADGRKLQTQTSFSGNPIQSRSFRVLQKITGSEDEGQTSEAGSSNGWDTNTSPPYYPNYWYYPPQTPEEQQQFWEHYNAMCNYMAHMNATAMRYSPYPYPPYPSPYPYPPYPSDTEDYSNSSCDEMSYYGKMFKQQAELRQQSAPAQTNNQTSQDPPRPECEESGEDTDTEVDGMQANALKSIRSVPDIQIYAESDESSSEESDLTDEEDPESDTASLPHQLSVIFEESELSSCDEKKRINEHSSSTNSSTSTINENAVKVRLPLQLTFTRSETNEKVATLIVGNSEMERSKLTDEADKENVVDDSSLIITHIVKEECDPDVSATIVLRKPIKEAEKRDKSEESPVDFWKELSEESSTHSRNAEEVRSSEEDSHCEDDSSSTSIQTVKKGNSGSDTMSEVEANSNVESSEPTNNCKIEDEMEEESSNDSTSEEEDENKEESHLEVKLIQKIKELQKEECSNDEEEKSDEEEEDSDSSETSSSDEESQHSNEFDDNSKKIPDKKGMKMILHSSKSFEESEEDDSGVTSDLSRHISETDTDPECGSELGKMSRCQRAATHSRLFKLLQEECEQEEENEGGTMSKRKEQLTLPLSNSSANDDSLSSSSGVNSPSSPVISERLVKELIQSLLSKKKGRHFRKLPMEKLHAAAMRILQEDMDTYDTVSTSDESNVFLSPIANSSKRSVNTPADTTLLDPAAYGANYYDYCNYYSTWGTTAGSAEAEYDIVPSKTFKILQGQGERSSPVAVRCPRVQNSIRAEHSSPVPPNEL